MKLALLFSVVALVVGQPLTFPQPAPQPYQPCRIFQTVSSPQYQCCRPDVFGGCRMEPGSYGFPPGAPVPPQFRPTRPPALPFLRAVCCPDTQECCPTQQGALFPSYECCDTAGGENCFVDSDGKGTCSTTQANGTTVPALELDGYGRCPDGTLPVQRLPGQPFSCTLNKFLPSFGCPPNTYCVKDRQQNVNTGVCCRNTECDLYDTCEDCASAPLNTTLGRAGCSWLSQGDLYDPSPRCVANCQNFPERSCIVGGLSLDVAQSRCPRTASNPNGTNYNTGSCSRRCGLVGTGRSSRITNGSVINNNTNAIPCCMDFPGDYCCDSYGGLSGNCAFGRVFGGPICGVPIRGTPNRFPPGFYGTPFQPVPFFARAADGTVDEDLAASTLEALEDGELPEYARSAIEEDADSRQMFFFRPPMPGFYPPPPPFLPPPPPRYQAPPVDQRPSQFICSCDKQCESKYLDCCDDYTSFCVNTTATA